MPNNLATVAEHRNMPFLKRGITAIDYKDRQGKVLADYKTAQSSL